MSRGQMSYEDYRALRRFHALDGLRAVSIFVVILAHSRNGSISLYSEGTNGVLLFFVLSGFLITSLLLREESKHGRVSLPAFVVRRVFRILPLYYVALGLYVVLVLVLHVDPRGPGFRQALPFYTAFFQEHVRFAPHPAAVPFYPFEVAWSLGIEEKFYLLWPALAFVVLAKAQQWRLPAAAVLTAVTILAPIYMGHLGLYFVYYAALLCGCLVALVLHAQRSYLVLAWFGTQAGLPVAFAVATVGYALTYLQNWTTGWVSTVVTVQLFPCFAVLVAGLVTTKLRPRDVFDWRPAVIVGQASYAAYLLHLIFLNGAEKIVPARFGVAGDVAALALGIALTFAISILVQRYFEGPITEVGHRLADRRFPRGPVAEQLEPLDAQSRTAQLAEG